MDDLAAERLEWAVHFAQVAALDPWPSGALKLRDEKPPEGATLHGFLVWRTELLYALVELGRASDGDRGEITGLNRVLGWLSSEEQALATLEARAAHERRLLAKYPDPLSAAAVKMAKMRAALWTAVDKGPSSERRASGDCVCEVCGDMYHQHTHLGPELPGFVGVCSGDRLKL